ncbi:MULTISPECIES: V-type ATP synthase subunit D [Fusobacterium]|jgi:V-type ATPase, D subunit|uniref:V-type ATP synthase subunit D n=1 Tax=Fusobacterium pseudoperiodonticum TaxID=2663009 RepID=A0A2D3PQH9_9FUSO|nr:V-type ATP synthase subunit D [Fusobacterium pseudoperiodonticum]MBF1208057.1 V-type ATP synthase subunit D [Fusobacterium periodonticum]ATV69939.1 V-type ATP synthase subunit D [Fusobacterium pseudoperiodonticum]MBF1215129.1 V-type ATP synthase subunit D [Fusobacterium periodonticum]MBS5869346.1 V-type ATP synthase subunit D [Fusobacterium periodonticum]MDU2235762.1 V-type ATP synthase subunit D [Fusobacterium periodonticum]
MAKLKVNPTRMALSELKLRLVTAKRGHKLLKDKQDELMRQFINLIKENKKLRMEVEKELSESFKSFLLASATMSPLFLESAVSFPKEKLSVDIKSKNIMSVNVPEMKFVKEEMEGSIFPYGFVQTSAELDDTVIKLQKVLDNLLSLAEIEKSCQLMADEIEKTRRRVNALEYSTIPNLEETVKDIRMKLDENERATITRLMKVKQMLEKNA